MGNNHLSTHSDYLSLARPLLNKFWCRYPENYEVEVYYKGGGYVRYNKVYSDKNKFHEIDDTVLYFNSDGSIIKTEVYDMGKPIKIVDAMPFT